MADTPTASNWTCYSAWFSFWYAITIIVSVNLLWIASNVTPPRDPGGLIVFGILSGAGAILGALLFCISIPRAGTTAPDISRINEIAAAFDQLDTITDQIICNYKKTPELQRVFAELAAARARARSFILAATQ